MSELVNDINFIWLSWVYFCLMCSEQNKVCLAVRRAWKKERKKEEGITQPLYIYIIDPDVSVFHRFLDWFDYPTSLPRRVDVKKGPPPDPQTPQTAKTYCRLPARVSFKFKIFGLSSFLRPDGRRENPEGKEQRLSQWLSVSCPTFCVFAWNSSQRQTLWRRPVRDTKRPTCERQLWKPPVRDTVKATCKSQRWRRPVRLWRQPIRANGEGDL